MSATDNDANFIPLPEVERAIRAYALSPDAIEPMNMKTAHALLYRVTCGPEVFVARVRSSFAQSADIVFARAWALAVEKEVPVPVPLVAPAEIPRCRQRLMDIAPFINHEHTDAHKAGPDAWERVGEWLGRIHRLGLPLTHSAPANLPYGNHPTRQRIDGFFARAAQTQTGTNSTAVLKAKELWNTVAAKMESFAPHLPKGVVHGDMHFWNVLYIANQPVAIIDLDFLQSGALIFDLAYASIWLSAWDREHDAWRGITKRYFAAYEIALGRPLLSVEQQALPWARMMTALHFFSQRAGTPTDNPLSEDEDLRAAETLMRENG